MHFRLPSRKKLVRFGLAFLAASCLLAVVLGLGLSNLLRSDHRQERKLVSGFVGLSRPDLTYTDGSVQPGNLPPGQAALNIVYTVGKLDPIADKTAKIFIEFHPAGTLSTFTGSDADAWQDAWYEARSTAAFTVTTQYKTFSFKAGERALQQDQTIFVGDADRYPLDEQPLLDLITATWIDPSTNASAPLPVVIVDYSWQQGWNFKFDASDSTVASGGIAQPRWTYANVARRNATTKILSFGIITLMWMLSVTYFLVGVRVVVTDRKVDLTVAALGATLMFGLNALRAAQPGIPPTGCIADTFGYMWNMCLMAACCIMAIGHYLWRINRLPSVPAPPPKVKSDGKRGVQVTPV
ncbi:hypothetical protein HKX48_006615 [Thoreauomyces humboldtii]|nr:hypothetical protein HKX48_006615 [Thoreauomyces humboldtii]